MFMLNMFMKFMFNIWKNCMKFTMIYHFNLKEKKLKKLKNLWQIFMIKKCRKHIKKLKQPLNHILVLKKVHRVLKFNRKAWLKPYIVMNTELRKKAQHDFQKYFFKFMNN